MLITMKNIFFKIIDPDVTCYGQLQAERSLTNSNLEYI